jgi:uncharacterized protein YkwD
MKVVNRSRYLLISIFIFSLFFVPNFQRISSAQDNEGRPTGLGNPPQVGRELIVNQSLRTESDSDADAEYMAFLPLTLDPATTAQLLVCPANQQENKIATMAKADPNQERPEMNCDPILSQVAHARAQDMAQKGYFSHINMDGYGPNYLVAQAGYDLPDWWSDSKDANYIESIAAGYSTAQAAWEGWLNSSSHRTHVLGENDFWAEQTNYGMGYVYIAGSPYGHYWVFITAPPEGS